MRNIPIVFFLATTALWFGCASPVDYPTDDPSQVLYYDRNGDGKVDFEKHHYPHAADRDWELRDDDFNGRYETKVLYGIGVIKSKVDRSVPTGVQIESKE